MHFFLQNCEFGIKKELTKENTTKGNCPTSQSNGSLPAAADSGVGTKKSLNKDYCDKSIQKV
jgi:hypothetical protein